MSDDGIDDLKRQVMDERWAGVRQGLRLDLGHMIGRLKDQGVRLELRYYGGQFEARLWNGTWGMTVPHDDAIEAVRLATIRYESEAVRRWLEGER